MTLDQAIQLARALEWAAAEGWPMGVPEDLAEQCEEALATIDAYVAGQPADRRQEIARRIRQRIEAREYTATVAPRQGRAT